MVTEIEDGKFCPECGTAIVTNKSKLSRILLALTLFGSRIFFGINFDKQFFGYSLGIIYIIGVVIITFTWISVIKRPQISISTLKRDFTT